MTRKKIIIAAVVLLIHVVGFLTVSPMGSYRYEITISVETPEGIKAGSAVQEISYSFVPKISHGISVERKIEGESVVVDLGARGVLFSVIDKKGMEIDGLFLEDNGAENGSKIRPHDTKVVLNMNAWPRQYPDLVHFRNLNQPTSAEAILIYESFDGPYPPERPNGPILVKQDRFEELFGKGVKLKEITVQMTDEPVTKGIVRKYLPWLEEAKDGIAGNTPTVLHADNFESH